MPSLPVWSNKFIPVDITAGTATHSAGDVVGGLLTFTNAQKNIQNEKSGGYVSDVFLTDSDNLAAALDLYLFRVAPTAIADDAAYAVTPSEQLTCFGKVSIAASDYSDVINSGGGTIGWAHKDALQLEFTPGDGNIYGYLVGAPDAYTNTDALKIALNVFTY